MSASVSISPTTIAVDPGGEATCEVRIRNTGSIVDQFTVEVLGEAQGWWEATPPTISLFPGTEESVQLAFRPPRSSTVPSGAVAFGVKVSSREDPAGTVVEEGSLEVGAFHDNAAELVPRTSRGRLGAVHQLSLANRGNAPLNADLAASDPDENLSFRWSKPSLLAPPGTAAFTKLKIKPRKRFLRGPAKTHPFELHVQPDGAEPMAVQGNMLQEALIPRWLIPALLALLALALIWLFLLKPTVESAAQEAVLPAQEAQAEQIADAKEQAQAAEDKADEALEGDGGPPQPRGGGGGGGDGVERPADGRLVFQDGEVVSQGNITFPLGEKLTLSITDLVLSNPEGDSGTITLLRDDDVLLVTRLDNFRDLDYHFITPLVFTAGQSLELEVDCANKPREDGTEKPCRSEAVYYTGSIVKKR